ncbi:MAG: hypothetical protein ACFFDF_09785 [Candidatus Odinarchaeota archaeon]
MIKVKRIKQDSYIRFIWNFPEGYIELFEQMVITKNVDTGEIRLGMMEHLRHLLPSIKENSKFKVLNNSKSNL